MINQSVIMHYGRQKKIESMVKDRMGKDAK